jgi:hypothetical protein
MSINAPRPPDTSREESVANTAPDASPRCSWCGEGFDTRQSGGKPRRFCAPRCRRAFDGAARIWVRQAVEDGTMTAADLRKAAQTTRALLAGPNSLSTQESGPESPERPCARRSP